MKLGQWDAATKQLARAVELKPDYAQTHYNLGTLLLARAKRMRPLPSFPKRCASSPIMWKRWAIWASPDEPGPGGGRDCPAFRGGAAPAAGAGDTRQPGSGAADQNRLEEAATEFGMVLRLKPEDIAAHFNLGRTLARQHNTKEATEPVPGGIAAETGFRRRPEQPGLDAVNGSGPTVARRREAVQLAKKRCELTQNKQANPLLTLAAAVPKRGNLRRNVKSPASPGTGRSRRPAGNGGTEREVVEVVPGRPAVPGNEMTPAKCEAKRWAHRTRLMANIFLKYSFSVEEQARRRRLKCVGELEHTVLTTLLLAILSFVLVVGTVLVFLIIQWQHRKTLSALTHGEAAETNPPPGVSSPSFGLKQANCWLAIKQRSSQAVQSALALHNPQPCSWADGLADGGGQRVFVSPPVSGWTLVMGPALPDPCDDADACFRFVLELSRKLGHVQLFSVNTILGHHAWVRAEGGQIVRAYAWAGGTQWNQGRRTMAEDELNLECRDYGETAAMFTDDPEPGVENTDKVHVLAARWSIDPDEIDGQFAGRAWGIAGEASRPY